MDTIKVQPTTVDHPKRSGILSSLVEKARSLRLFNIQSKLIIPYVVLTLTIAAIGTYIITKLVVSSGSERFHNMILNTSQIAGDNIVRQERGQLEKLRPVLFAEGMSAAIKNRNSDEVVKLIKPFLISQNLDLITAIDQRGTEIITYGKYPNEERFYNSQGTDFSFNEVVRKVLTNVTDDQGDKYAELLQLEQGPALITIAPVKDENNKVVGALMSGTYIEQIRQDLKQQSMAGVGIIFFDLNGKVIDTSLSKDEEGYGDLLNTVAQLQPTDKFRTFDFDMDRRPVEVAYSPLIIRGKQAGWLGVIMNRDYLVSDFVTSRNLFIGLFTFGTLLVILVGYSLAQNIARPILKLRLLSQAVAAGDLNQHIGLRRSDEIGELSEAFDTMTEHLKERTEEAERLYAESLQRNRELAEINARLEATQLQLIQSEKLAAIGQLTAGIVHDVKNPFAVIMGMSEVLGDTENLDEDTRHGLKTIRESAIKGNTIVSDLLKFARQSKPEMRYMDLRETVKTALRLTAYLTRRYEPVVELPEAPLMTTYDAQQVEQVLINLIHNAVQAMPKSGSLAVKLEQVEDKARISVQDTGCGIAPEHLKRIFDPFFTTKPEGEGTGLGLSVSYGIIANHQGVIEVESEVGKGTVFTIVLPIHQPILAKEELNS